MSVEVNNLTPTPGSVFQMANLIDAKFDIATTAIDQGLVGAVQTPLGPPSRHCDPSYYDAAMRR